MTWALCFHCGETKFGAIVPCPECNVGSTGNMQLDIAFSDHRISKETIAAFGKVVQAIRQVCDDDELRIWSFLQYISINHPDLLKINLDPEMAAKTEATLVAANPPPVSVVESERGRMTREMEERKALDASANAEDG
jgi:hypothetical protein